MSDQPGIAPRSVLVVTPDELAAVDSAAKARDAAQQAEIKRLNDRLAALEAAPPPPVQPPIEPPVEPPVEPPIQPPIAPPPPYPPGPNLTYSDARRRHVCARRKDGAFVDPADGAIEWSTVKDYGDIALLEDPAHKQQQMHPEFVRGDGDSHKGVAWAHNIGAADLGEIAASPRINSADPLPDKRRVARVQIPGTTGRYAWLQRLRQNPDQSAGSVWRNELRQLYANSYGIQRSTFEWDAIPRHVEVWWAVAQMFDPFNEETWGPWTGGQMCFGHQVHAIDVIPLDSMDSPQDAFYLSGRGNEDQHRWWFRTRGPVRQGENVADTPGCKFTTDVLWERIGLPMGIWQFMVHRRILSASTELAETQMWYAQGSDAYDPTPSPVVDCSASNGARDYRGARIDGYANDTGCGPTLAHKQATPYAGNWGILKADGTRIDPNRDAGDPWLSVSCMYAYPPTKIPVPSMTILSIPTPWHHRNPHRSVREYAGDLLLMMRRSVGL
jgi:hypothetical protein